MPVHGDCRWWHWSQCSDIIFHTYCMTRAIIKKKTHCRFDVTGILCGGIIFDWRICLKGMERKLLCIQAETYFSSFAASASRSLWRRKQTLEYEVFDTRIAITLYNLADEGSPHLLNKDIVRDYLRSNLCNFSLSWSTIDQLAFDSGRSSVSHQRFIYLMGFHNVGVPFTGQISFV